MDNIAKNLLLDKTCQTCIAQKSSSEGTELCVRYLGEACGWQWWPRNKENTCEDWKNE